MSDTNGEQPISNMIAGIINKVSAPSTVKGATKKGVTECRMGGENGLSYC